jgi:hypothetical protein
MTLLFFHILWRGRLLWLATIGVLHFKMLPATEINPRHEFICHHLTTYQFSMFQVFFVILLILFGWLWPVADADLL